MMLFFLIVLFIILCLDSDCNEFALLLLWLLIVIVTLM